MKKKSSTQNLLEVVGKEGGPAQTDSAGNPLTHQSFGQVHRVGNRQHNQLGVAVMRPIKQVVQHVLFVCLYKKFHQ